MTPRLLATLGACLTLLAACGKPASEPPAAPAASPANDRAGPVRWNAATEAFELNGRALRTAKLWTFDGSTEGFTGVGSQVTPGVDGGLAVTVADPTLRSPSGLTIPGGQYSLVLVRLTRMTGGEAWDGALYYKTPDHPEAITHFAKPKGAGPAVGETVTLVYDMSRLAAGDADWMNAMIDQIRLDLDDKAGGQFFIRQIAIAENPDAAPIKPAAEPATPEPKG